MAELIESQACFGFRLEGDNEIDATILSNTIRDIGELAKLASSEENPEAYLKMNVTAFKNGSFQIDFSAVCQVAENLFTGIVVASGLAGTVVGTVKGFLEIKKLLKGEEPKSIKPICDNKIEVENIYGEKAVVNKSSGAIFKDMKIDKLSINISNYVLEHNPNGGFIFSDQEGDLRYSSEDIKNMSRAIPFVEEKLCKCSTVETDLIIKKADLIGRSAWDFKYKGYVISAKIDDEDWLEKVNNGDISIRAGDYINATLEIYVELNILNVPIQDSEKYKVVKINGNIQHKAEQISL